MRSATHRTGTLAGTIALAAFAALPSMLAAQDDPTFYDNGADSPVFLAVDAGAALPGADLNDISDVGFALGGELGWRATDRVALKLDVATDLLRDQPGFEAVQDRPEDLALYHYGAGLEVRLWEPRSDRVWNLAASLGGGATTLDTDPFVQTADGAMNDFTRTYPNANTGLTVSFRPTSSVELELTGESFVAFADEDETAVLTENVPGVDAMGTAVTYPVTLALEWQLPRMR